MKKSSFLSFGTAAIADQPRHKLGVLEIGRFIAASLVVLSHLSPMLAAHAAPGAWVARIPAPGPVAVQFFFVLSGFVMITAHGSDFGRPGAVANFWWRRACRIYPMYWIALLLSLLYTNDALTPRRIAELITLQPVNVHDFVGPAWSLRFEIGFYAMFGLCLLPFIGRFLLAGWFLLVCFCWCPISLFQALHLPIPFGLYLFYVRHAQSFVSPASFLSPACFYFFSGVLGGWIFQRRGIGRLASVILVVIGSIVLLRILPALNYGYAYGSMRAGIIAGIGLGGIITGLAILERHGVLRLGAVARRLGAISYPLYILHLPVLLLVGRWIGGPRLATVGITAMGAGLLLLVYAISVLLTFGVDQPLQSWLRHRGRQPAAQAGSPAQPSLRSAP